MLVACRFIGDRIWLQGPCAPPHNAPDSARKVYGEWRIHIRPDQSQEYNQLIAEQGLPLFRAAGGRMVGWWTTLVGDLYEHLTIWEYDDMAAFEHAIEFLGGEQKFAQFVKDSRSATRCRRKPVPETRRTGPSRPRCLRRRSS